MIFPIHVLIAASVLLTCWESKPASRKVLGSYAIVIPSRSSAASDANCPSLLFAYLSAAFLLLMSKFPTARLTETLSAIPLSADADAFSFNVCVAFDG